MSTTSRRPLVSYLVQPYPFDVIADPDGGYVVVFPDLPGCMTQVESVDDVGRMAEDARRLWIETAYEQGLEIPLPSFPETYSGKFNLRLPKSLHRELAESAERNGVSLNQHVVTLLARRDTGMALESRLARIEQRLDDLNASIQARERERSSLASQRRD